VRCALVVDVRGWAFLRIAKGIVKYNPDPSLNIDVSCEVELRGVRGRIFDGYDVLYAFSPYQAGVFLSRGYNEWITTLHMNPLQPELPPGVVPKASSYSAARYRAIMAAKRVSVLNDMQLEMMQKVRPDTVKLRVGFDPDVFYPKKDWLLIPPEPLWVDNYLTPEKPCKRFDLVSRCLPKQLASVAPSEYFSLLRRRDRHKKSIQYVGTEVKGMDKANRCLRVGWVGNPEKAMKRFDMVKKACIIDGIELCTVAKTYMEEGLLSQTEMADFYRGLDVYLCLSDHEGLPTPALEAAACGIPIVSTPVGIMPELIENGLNGYMVSQSVDEVQAVLRYLRDDRSACQSMGTASYALVEDRAWPNVVNEWTKFIIGGSDGSR